MVRLLFFFIWFAAHPVHVTLTSLDYDHESKELRGFVKLYFDDFLLDCMKAGPSVKEEKFISRDPSAFKVMEDYLNEKLLVSVNEKLLPGKLKDMSIANNEVNLNIIFVNGKRPKTITVKNLIMTGLYKDQSNLVIVKVNDFEQGVKLNSDLTEQTILIK